MNKLLISRFRNIFRIGYLKTAYINFRLLPFVEAIKFPIIVSRAITFGSLSGRMKINCAIKTGLVRFGFFHSDLMSWKGTDTFVDVKGFFLVNGWMQFGVGYNLCVDENSVLEIGNNCSFGSLGKIICRERITIDKNFRSGWEVQILDTNFHYIKDIENGYVSSRTKPIVIGKNNWMGFRSSVMQGTITPDYFIVASNSTCNKDYSVNIPNYSMVGGVPAKLLKSNVILVLDKEEKEIQKEFYKTAQDSIFTDITIREV